MVADSVYPDYARLIGDDGNQRPLMARDFQVGKHLFERLCAGAAVARETVTRAAVSDRYFALDCITVDETMVE